MAPRDRFQVESQRVDIDSRFLLPYPWPRFHGLLPMEPPVPPRPPSPDWGIDLPNMTHQPRERSPPPPPVIPHLAVILPNLFANQQIIRSTPPYARISVRCLKHTVLSPKI
jgi:hypothetical protein